MLLINNNSYYSLMHRGNSSNSFAKKHPRQRGCAERVCPHSPTEGNSPHEGNQMAPGDPLALGRPGRQRRGRSVLPELLGFTLPAGWDPHDDFGWVQVCSDRAAPDLHLSDESGHCEQGSESLVCNIPLSKALKYMLNFKCKNKTHRLQHGTGRI